MTRQQPAQRTHRIALLFNANKVYDREIITGIGKYLLSTRASPASASICCRRAWHGTCFSKKTFARV
jgi:hypothetical protein